MRNLNSAVEQSNICHLLLPPRYRFSYKSGVTSPGTAYNLKLIGMSPLCVYSAPTEPIDRQANSEWPFYVRA